MVLNNSWADELIKSNKNEDSDQGKTETLNLNPTEPKDWTKTLILNILRCCNSLYLSNYLLMNLLLILSSIDGDRFTFIGGKYFLILFSNFS